MPRSRTPEDASRGTRRRSRSPYRDSHGDKKRRSHEHRSRSPRRDNDRHRHKRKRSRSPPPAQSVVLPYKAKQLSKRQYEEYKPLFQSYLDIQKQIHLDELGERETKGRWKSFVSRWNRGELARSWYDPSMLTSARETAQSYERTPPRPTKRASPTYDKGSNAAEGNDSDDDNDDDDFGPALPPDAVRHRGHGPTVPRLDDLQYRDEMRNEDRARDRSNHAEDVRYERKTERKTQKERLEELVPRADPGSRERQLEKKRETTSTLQSFRDAKEGGDVEVAEADLMGDDGVDAYKKKKREDERQKNEREIRREEIMRARAAEREERLSERREKESKTMDFLKQLAKERYG